jgi:hypothetical protein
MTKAHHDEKIKAESRNMANLLGRITEQNPSLQNDLQTNVEMHECSA